MHSSIKRTPLAAAIIIALNAPLYSSAVKADLIGPAPGDMIGSEFLVNTYTVSAQKRPSVAMDADGDFVVAWQSYGQDGSNYGIFAQRYNADGSTAGSEFAVNTVTSNVQNLPAIAMDADGDFVIAWQSDGQDGNGNGIIAQRYNADGSTVGSDFVVNTHTANSQSNASIAMDADGDFVIAWQSFGQNTNGYGIYAQRFNADGSTAGSEFKVNTYDESSNLGAKLLSIPLMTYQTRPTIAMDADGDFVIAWQSSYQDGSNSGIYAQRYTANGNTAGSEFRVNTNTTGDQTFANIAMDADGDFVVVWNSRYQDGSGDGIYAQRYNAAGVAAGGEVLVNTYTTDGQATPNVAMDADGDFVVAWQSYGQDAGTYGVYAQRYIADGTAAGVEFSVNSYADGPQYVAKIAMDADGDFVIAWESQSQDGDYFGVYGQRYIGNQTLSNVDLNLVVQDNTDPVTVGDNFVYSLITTNNGSGIAMDVNLNTALPAGLAYVSDDAAGMGWNCAELATTLNCNKPFMTPAEMNTINITVKATAAGTLSNTVTASAGQVDTNAADNTDTETTEVEAKAVVPGDDDDGILGIGSMQGVFSLLIALPLWLRRRFKA